MIILKEDQQRSVDGVAAAMKRTKAVLLQGATGSGKSVIGSYIIQRATLKQKRCWFVVPRRDLIKQMAETFADFGIEHSYIASKFIYDPFASNFICSTETLRLRLTKVRAPDLAFIDETHFGGEGLDEIIKWLKAAGTWIIGLSATPWKMNGEGLGKWYDEMVSGPSIRWLIDNKRLADYRAFAPTRPDLSKIKIEAGDYAKGQLTNKMESDTFLIGNAVNHYKEHAMGRLGVTFGVSTRHSEQLAEAYREAGIPAMHIDGKTPDDLRRQIARGFAKRELLQLCCAELLTFGWDLASASGIKNVCVEVMNDCAPTLSLAKQKQKNGRNFRYDPNPHLFFDHANNIEEHGMPCEEPEWTLSDRLKSKGGGGEKLLPVKQCEKCFYCERPRPQCSNCGYVHPIMFREIEQIEGQLTELEIKKQKKKEEKDCKTMKDFIELAEERGYPNPAGWAGVRMGLKDKYKKKYRK